MNSYSFSKQQIANYLINRSFLTNKAPNIETVLNFYKCIQVDPINVLMRSHELSLWNRVENFKISDLSDALYKRHELFEYWFQLFSIIPVKYYPYFDIRRKIKSDWQEKYYEQHKESIDLALDFIKENGVTSAKDLSHIPSGAGLFSWTSTSSRTALLEYLWDRGEIMIHHRSNNHKFYDLSERILPKTYEKKSEDESKGFILLSYFDYLGLVRTTFLSRLGYVRKFDLKEKLNQFLEEGKIVKILIEGVKTKYFVTINQLHQIETLGQENLHNILNLISPLDPLIIDRQILKDVFEFDYTWEAYTPQVKRKVGFYNMPILYKGNFVGQIYAVKKDGKIKVENLISSVKNKDFDLQLKMTLNDIEKIIKT